MPEDMYNGRTGSSIDNNEYLGEVVQNIWLLNEICLAFN